MLNYIPQENISCIYRTNGNRTIAMHNRFVCKPGRIMAHKRFMAYVAAKPGA